MLIDIHTHTYPTSDDSTLTPEELISRAKLIGLDGVCLTDHDGFWDPADVEKLGKDNDFLVIPGCEVTTEEGHLLVYGLTEYIFGMHKSAFVKDLVDEAGGAIVVAHPYRRVYRETAPQDEISYSEMIERGLRNEVFDIVDAIEIRNGRGSDKENEFSENLANKLNMPKTGASDAHKLIDIGTYATEFYDKITGLDDLIKSIKSGRYDAKELKFCPREK
ncbi:MAG: PHP domain-containing protein [Chloroflexota bacterium]|nr:PHP domain-containing protein [Chloroflexota bacterium]